MTYSIPAWLSVACTIAAALGGFTKAAAAPDASGPLLRAENFNRYFDQFNTADQELYPQHVSNAKAWPFLRDSIPFFECPDPEIERTYYFRWWTFRKHLKQTEDGFVITEFLPPVGWAGKHNTISCAAGHHFYEGRWLHDPVCLDDYAVFWFRKGGSVRTYSFWAADALLARSLVTGDDRLALELLPDLIANYREWEKSHRASDGLFWQNDGNDGMEVSIGGSGKRATINAYMYGDAMAIAKLAARAGQDGVAKEFRDKAAQLKALVQTKLWDPKAQFFKTLPREQDALVDVRELHGFTPWYFNLPDPGREIAWRQLFDPQGFWAAWGPTTAEQRHPGFRLSYEGHECQWNGPSWPYATAVTLTALANVLNNYRQDIVGRADYFKLLGTYARSHQLTRPDGQTVPWIDENLNPHTGDWIARTRLKSWKDGTWDPGKGGVERGKDYNHSTFCDLVISGLIGLRPRADAIVEVNPLVPANTWDWFCLDNILYHGRALAIFWDKTGERYGRGKGLHVLADGREIARADSIGRVEGQLPSTPPGTAAGWRKSPSNPVLGGDLGTCFDVTLLKETGQYRMWFSWRPKKAVALTESSDGIHWNTPRIVLGPNRHTDWEEDINRPSVLKCRGQYHMWYTGQSSGRSWIGHATSANGTNWERRSATPVLSPEKPWEKVAVMCPHVIWDAEKQIYRMWYSAGDQYEPDAIGYATSNDGARWVKHDDNPIFAADRAREWEQHKVTACQVMPCGEWHVMFYIGFRDEDHAQIGIARSRDGIAGWERHPRNPVIFPTKGDWDADACYKPFAIFEEDEERWLLWYNGRKGNMEQIGLATHPGRDLNFAGE